ncbi:brevican core protein-like [Solea senegalensis]|uniref:Brevican core protein-like n=1 Tax=Solea senegalensis TaxID=28829 RepID=A0AAV6R602_SOLSE|nr:brevican core protein-like [Solea senegalensis]KAG7499894.1 brevican core protein-like [Solea senegalensis]
MLLNRIRHVLPLLCVVCPLTLAFPTQTPSPHDDFHSLQVNIPHSGPVSALLGSSISIPCLVSLSSAPTTASSSPILPRVKWTVVSGGVETQILVARGHRVKVNEAFRNHASLLNYTSSLDDLSLWLRNLRSSDSGHYRCEVQQGLEDASDIVQLKVKGVVFHYRDALGRYQFSFHQAQRACEAIGAEMATADQLLAAYYNGYEQCDAGWLADQSVRYPIQTPREGCYGDMDGQPGVRNYGTMDVDDLFDVYCYVEQINGEVFHDSIPQHLSFAEAQTYCRATGAELATTAQLYLAWSEGLDRCSPGWLSDGSVRFPIITPRERCGGPQAGVKTIYRFSNQTGFPEPSSLHDVYCFKDNRNVPTDSPVDHEATEPEDIGQDVVILTEKDQELQLNQYAEQVEREAQSLLESFAYVSPLSTQKNLSDTQPTNVSDTTESPLNTTSTLDLLQPFDESSSPTDMSSHSMYPSEELTYSTASSRETYDVPQNTSLLPSVYNETDSPLDFNLTSHQFELERTTEFPEISNETYSHNQTVPDSDPEEHTEPLETLKDSQEIQETYLDVTRSQANYSETDSNSTRGEENAVEASSVTSDNMLQVKFEEATVTGPGLMSPSTQSPSEEDEFKTQTTKAGNEDLTTPWLSIDGSGDISQERDLDAETVSFTTSSDSSASGFTTHPSPPASASSVPVEPWTGIPHPTSSSDTQSTEKRAFSIVTTVAQLWESSISKQEGSTSLESEDSVTIDTEEEQLHVTKAEDTSFATTKSSERSNSSQLPTDSTTALYRTPGSRGYWGTATIASEEASGLEPGTDTVTAVFGKDNKVAPTEEIKVFPTVEGEAKVSFSLEQGVKVSPTPEEDIAITLTFEGEILPTLEEEAKGSFSLDEEVTLSPVYERELNVHPTTEEKTNFSTAMKEETYIARTLDVKVTPVLKGTTVSPTSKEEYNITSTIEDDVVPILEKFDVGSTIEEEANVVPTPEQLDVGLTSGEQANVSLHLEEEANFTTVLGEESKIASTSEENVNFAPTVEEDFTIYPLDSQSSNWALVTTTTGPQESVNDLEYSRRTTSPSSTAASRSSTSTKPTRATTGTTSTTITTTTHWSRRAWSPTTSTPRIFHKTTGPQRVTHHKPPVDQGLVDVEFSSTQPPTLLILPNERAAVGSTGKASDACVDNPCLNGGTCTDRDGQIKCLCLPTYGGTFCQTDMERCEPGWDKFHGFCYRHFGQRLSWEVAEQHCRMLGAHLVSIMTPEEQSYINSNYKEYQWTGLNDKTIEDDFRWSDGNPLLYENWYRGQPDSYFLSGEDCVVMVWHDDGRWSDVPCNYHLAYTCKKGTSSCGPPPKVRNTSIFGKARQRYETNAVVRYHCAKGFQQRLSPLIRCLPGGMWERPQIMCTPEAGGPTQQPEQTSATHNLAAIQDEFEAKETKKMPQYWDIKF